MSNSSKRLALPEFDKTELQRCIQKLVSIDQDWVPRSTSSTLYIRPTYIGDEPTLGVSVSKSALLYVITGPVGPYFPTGFKPVSLLADPAYVRAWIGGGGAYKIGANYAPTISVQAEALKKYNCQQVRAIIGFHPNFNISTICFHPYFNTSFIGFYPNFNISIIFNYIEKEIYVFMFRQSFIHKN